MRKLLLLPLSTFMLFLISCKVHFTENTYDVHWSIIAILTVLILIIAGVSLAKKKYVCPNCNKTFYTSWFKCLFSGHVNDERTLKCPHCKQVGACYPSYDQEDKK